MTPMASIIKKIFGFYLLCILLLNNCSIAQNNDLYNLNYKQLLTNDIINPINNVNDIRGMVETVCKIGCEDGTGLTGNFTLRYSLKNKSFTNLSNDTLIVHIPFVGYKCPNSLTDNFYTKLSLELQNNNRGSLPERVKKHIVKTRQENNYPPIIEIITEKDKRIDELSELIYQVILGYIKMYNEIAQARWNKEIIQLTRNEIETLKKMEPLNIRITPSDGDLYCK